MKKEHFVSLRVKMSIGVILICFMISGCTNMDNAVLELDAVFERDGEAHPGRDPGRL